MALPVLLPWLFTAALAAPELRTDQVWRGGTSTIVVSGAAPGTTVFLAGSGVGPGPGPCPPALAGACIDMRSPRLVGQAAADVNGDAVIDIQIPTALSLDLLWFQAVTVAGGVQLSEVRAAAVHGPDVDRDGLDDADEIAWATDPLVPDSDGDGLDDGVEVHRHGTDPLAVDTDGDDLTDPEELADLLDPTNPDTDGGGWSDGDELLVWHTDPADPSDDLVVPADADSDGLSDSDEVLLGTDPADPDSDCDGVPDGVEASEDGTDPLDPGSWRAGSVTLPPSPTCAAASSVPPELVSADCLTSVDVGGTWICMLQAVDPEGGPVTWTVDGGPPGLLVGTDGALSLLADPAAAGGWSLRARAVDAAGAALEFTLLLQVTGQGPAISGLVGAGGLTLNVPSGRADVSGVQVHAPAGAFPQGTRLTAREVVGAAHLGDAPTVEIDAGGLQPAVPMTLRWRLVGPSLIDLTDGVAPVLSRSGSALSWSVEGATATVDASTATATVEVTHLTPFSLVLSLHREVGAAGRAIVDEVVRRLGEEWALLQQPYCLRGADSGAQVCGVPPDDRFTAGQVNCLLLHGIRSDGETFDGFTEPDSGLLVGLSPLCENRIVVDYPSAHDQRVVAASIASLLLPDLDPNARFMIVAHSNGGLVARSIAAMHHPVADGLIGIVTLDTPHRGGQVEALRLLFPEELALPILHAVVPGVANLVATRQELWNPASFLNWLTRQRQVPIACVGALDPVYRATALLETDGLVHRNSAVDPCEPSWQHSPDVHPNRFPDHPDQTTVTLADRLGALTDGHAAQIFMDVHNEVHRRAFYDGATALAERMWASLDHDLDGIPDTEDCDVIMCGDFTEVWPGDDLQVAVDGLVPGGILTLHAGTYDVYRLHITVPGVTLRASGDGPVTVSGEGDLYGTIWVDAAADDVTFEDLYIYNTTDDPSAYDAGIYSQGDRTTVGRCTFSGPLPTAMQVYFQQSVGARVEDCRFDTFNTAITFDDADGTVDRVHIQDGHDGVLVAPGSDVVVSNALIARPGQGFVILGDVELDVWHSTVIDASVRAAGLYDGTTLPSFHATVLARNARNMDCVSFSFIDLDDVYAEGGSSGCLFVGQLFLYGATLALDGDGYPTAGSGALVDRRGADPDFALDVDRRPRPFDGDGDGFALSDLGAVERLPAHAEACTTDQPPTCVCADGWAWDGAACVDIDECADDPCSGAPCLDGEGSFTCECPFDQVFDGQGCIDITACAPDPCAAPRTCQDTGSDLVCGCPLGSLDVGGVCTFAPDCGAIHATWPAAPSARYWLDPDGDGLPLRTWCDMNAAGGGWTLLLHAGPSFRVSTAGPLDDADCYATACTSRAWEQLPLGHDLRIDGSDIVMGSGAAPVSMVIQDIDPLTRGRTLRELFDAMSWSPLERDDNANVQLQWAPGYGCGTWGDFGEAACGTKIFVFRDDLADQYLGGRFSRASEWGNLASWPGDPDWSGGNYWPDQLRIWTR